VRTEDGETFGPVPKSELDEWVSEGRLTADTQILRDGADQWQWATDEYPQLAELEAPAVQTAPNPFDFSAVDTAAPRKSGPKSSSKMSDKSKVTAGLLGIFLGAWGVHRFYLGFTGIGVIQIVVTLCTLCLGGWWGVIEGIMILTGSINRDARGRKLRN